MLNSVIPTFALLLLSSAEALQPALHQALRPALSPQSMAHRSAQKAGIHIDVASEEKGLGAFATSSIKLGDCIGDYIGEILTKKQVQARYWGKRQPDADDESWVQNRQDRGQGITGNYVVEMKDGSFVDAEDGDVSGWCRFMNHASDGTPQCNVMAFDKVKTADERLRFPRFFAIRHIEEGEELCWDYGPGFW